jgi:flagellar protein FlbD
VISLRRANGFPVLVNPDLIETAETSPEGETLVWLTSGNSLAVRDSLEAVREAVIEFRRRIAAGPP